MSEISPGILKTKQHFDILDGLRGIAALAVVTFHFMEIAYSDYSQNFIGHGFLAVDFFFCLSGFVIGYAYDDRMGKMGVLEFLKSRLIRLHPLVVFGSVLGLLAFLFDPYAGGMQGYSVGKLVTIFLASVFMIPYPWVPQRALNLFGFNAPAWSLFWEYIANIFYAFVLIRIGRKLLQVLTVVAAIWLCYVGLQAGNLMGGWSGGTFWDGCARISYSFLAGLMVYRMGWKIKNNLGFLGMAILLMAAFLMPYGKYNWLTEPLVVVLYFPFMVALGAGAVLKPAFKKLCVLFGNISYPLYMTHYAVMWIFAGYFTANKPGTGKLALIIIAGLILLFAAAYLVMVAYDMPVRKWLAERRKRALKSD